MWPIRILSLMLVSFLAMGCSTHVTTLDLLPSTYVGNLQVTGIDTATTLPDLNPEVIPALKSAVVERMAKMPSGVMPVKIVMTVTEYVLKNGGARALIGAFAGDNRMTVNVKVLDITGGVISEFKVERRANPGGYGAFYAQGAAMINATADGITDGLRGMNGRRPS